MCIIEFVLNKYFNFENKLCKGSCENNIFVHLSLFYFTEDANLTQF